MKYVYIKYTYVFQIGVNEHKISFYKDYSPEIGLVGDRILTFSSSNKAFLLGALKDNGIKLPPEQITTLNSLMKYREDGIVNPEGKYLKY